MTALLACAALLAGNGDADSFYRPLDAEDVEVSVSPALAADGESPKFALGVHIGYLNMRDAEEGTFFYGLHARLYLLEILAIEASLDVAKSDFIDDDAELTMVPVMVSGLLIPFKGSIRPYALAGVGWYYQDIDYSGGLSNLDDEQESSFGVHLGLGSEIVLGRIVIHADFRYVFLDEPNVDNSNLDEEEFDFWYIAVGAAIGF